MEVISAFFLMSQVKYPWLSDITDLVTVTVVPAGTAFNILRGSKEKQIKIAKTNINRNIFFISKPPFI
jgi:hypothetical protein